MPELTLKALQEARKAIEAKSVPTEFVYVRHPNEKVPEGFNGGRVIVSQPIPEIDGV